MKIHERKFQNHKKMLEKKKENVDRCGILINSGWTAMALSIRQMGKGC